MNCLTEVRRFATRLAGSDYGGALAGTALPPFARRLSAKLAVACALLFLVGCAGGIAKDPQLSLGIVTPQAFDFRELEYYALRSKVAYASEEEIRRQFPDTIVVKNVEQIDVVYFIETDPVHKTQTLTVRGTANRLNLWQDLEVFLVLDSLLGHMLHKGFRDDALKVLDDAKPHLKKDHSIRVTGHSLGGAIAMIMAVRIYREGYNVERLVTFGQPKVTDEKGNSQYLQNPDYKRITRVVREHDPIPLVPELPRYGHVGSELILKEGQDYVFLDAHDASRVSAENFWRDFAHAHLKDHSMDLYLANIQGKIESGPRQVPYLEN